MYIEYDPGQHITPHIDGIAVDPMAWPRQIAGISVVVDRAQVGGGFFVETTGSDAIWSPLEPQPTVGYAPGMRVSREGADNSSTWYTESVRTRWTVDPDPGTALLYGSQLTHGTLPVHAGRCRKFISWLTADEPSSAER